MDERSVENELERLGLDPVDRGRYWTIHCPFHDDARKSCVCFKDGWICCMAGCPRKHVSCIPGSTVPRNYTKEQPKQEPLTTDWTDLWLALDPVESSVKGVGVDILNRFGWRRFPGGFGIPAGVFIPYFNIKRDRVPYFQVRHEPPIERRFSFPRGCSPIAWGLESLADAKEGDFLLITEGSRDALILRAAGVPHAVGIPSASSGTMLKKLLEYVTKNKLRLVCVTDRDEAGDKLTNNIDIPFIDARTPVGKDVGDLFEQEGMKGVIDYYDKYIGT